MEIEKKYLVKNLPKNLDKYKNLKISQGYISNTEPTIRIRQLGTEYILTIKSTENIEAKNKCIVNEEFEFKISEEKYIELSTKVSNTFIEKTRYYIPINNLMAELDIYHNQLNGLCTVEVEFNTLEEFEAFQPEDWFGEDVTKNIKYKNFYLSTYGLTNF